jgi:hypothetical protein
MDKKGSWRPQEAEKVHTETFLDDFEAQVEIKRGPRSTQSRSKTQKASATIRKIVFFLFLLLLRAQEANFLDFV